MALLPYLLDEVGPRRLRKLLFGRANAREDYLTDIFAPILRLRRYICPRRSRSDPNCDDCTITNDKDKFQVNLDVQHYALEEISVKVVGGYVVVEGRHDETRDELGYISREFKRKYTLPEDCNPETVQSKLSADGVLIVVAPKVSGQKSERAVPITQTGPVRRKQDEEQNEELNGEEEEETKTPQKKRRC